MASPQILCLVLLTDLFSATSTTSTTIDIIEISSTQMPFPSSQQLEWPMFAVIFGVLFGVSSAGLFYLIHATWFLYRRHKHGVLGKATVICRSITEYRGTASQNHKTKKYHLQLLYADQRAEISQQCIHKLIEHCISTHCSSDIPTEIEALIAQYLHHSLLFWYGPYEIESTVSEAVYNTVYVGSKIDINFDPVYAQNCELFLEPPCLSLWHWCRWCAAFLISMAGCFFCLFMLQAELQEAYYRQLLIVWSAVAVSLFVMGVLLTFYYGGSGCFQSCSKGDLQFTDCDEQDVMQDAVGIDIDGMGDEQLVTTQQLLSRETCTCSETSTSSTLLELSVSPST